MSMERRPEGRRFAAIPVEVVRLGAGLVQAYCALAAYADEHGRCWPTIRRLAEDTGVDTSTVSRRLAELVERGLVVRLRPGAKGRPTVYELPWPPEAEALTGRPVQPRTVVHQRTTNRTTETLTGFPPPSAPPEDNPSGPTATAADPSPENHSDVATVWANYEDAKAVTYGSRHRPSRLTDARRRLIARRLKDYDVADLCAAVRGWRWFPHNTGETTGTRWDSLELVLREANVERFRDAERNPEDRPRPEAPRGGAEAQRLAAQDKLLARIRANREAADQAALPAPRLMELSA